jgi:hypothetical protein
MTSGVKDLKNPKLTLLGKRFVRELRLNVVKKKKRDVQVYTVSMACTIRELLSFITKHLLYIP